LNPATGLVDQTSTPATRTGGLTDGWLGANQRGTEHTAGATWTLMGARLYLPTFGLFASVDPVEGGTDNAYAYVNDPINQYDLDGKWSRRKVAKRAWHSLISAIAKGIRWQDRTTRRAISAYVNFEWRNRMKILGAVAFGICVFATAAACLAAGVGGSVLAFGNATLVEHKPATLAAAQFAVGLAFSFIGWRVGSAVENAVNAGSISRGLGWSLNGTTAAPIGACAVAEKC
jgi:RHS repeat-associated protein